MTDSIKLKRECLLVESSFSGTDVEAPKQLRISCRKIQQNLVGGCRHADDSSKQGDSTSFQSIDGETPDKTSKFAASCQNVLVELGWIHGEVELDRKQHK